MATKRIADQLNTQYDPTTGAFTTKPQATTPAPTQPPAPGGADPTLAEQAANQGMPAAPASPVGAAGIGASPDQAKMAGTPAQLSSTQSVGPAQTDLAKADRAAEFQQQAISQEAASREQRRTELKAAYGDVGLGVDKMIQAALDQSKGSTYGGLASGYSVDEKKLAGGIQGFDILDDYNKTEIINAAQHLAENINDPAAVGALQTALAAAGKKGFTEDQLRGLLAQKTTEKATAEQVADTVRLDLDTLQSFGVDEADLAKIGLTPEQVQGMSLKDFQVMLNDAMRAEHNQITNLQARLADPNLPPDQRRMIQDQLRELGATGGYQSSADVKKIEEEQIADYDEKITVGGKEMTVDEMLGDDGISGIITQFLAAGEDSEYAKQLAKQFPQLVEFINRNKGALDKAAQQLQGTTTKTFEIQAANKAVRDAIVAQGGSLTDAAAILGDSFSTDEFGVTEIDPANSGILQMMMDPAKHGLTPDQMATAVKNIKAAVKQFPELQKDLAGLTPNELKATGAMENTPRWKDFSAATSQAKALESNDPGAIAKQFFGTDNLQQALDNALLISATTGKIQGTPLLILDANRDGILDDPATIKDKLSRKIETPELKAFAGGAPVKPLKDSDVSKTGTISSALKNAFADGVVTPKEASSLSMSNTDMLRLINGTGGRGISPETKKVLEGKIQKNKENASAGELDSIKQFLENGYPTEAYVKKLDDIIARAYKHPLEYDIEALKDALKKAKAKGTVVRARDVQAAPAGINTPGLIIE